MSEEKVTVVLLGASRDGLEERRAIARDLAGRGILAVIPEDCFPDDVALSLVERIMFSADEADLIFVNVQSWGSAAEFTELSGDEKVVGKLRVLVARQQHPICGSPPSSRGYLTDAYMTPSLDICTCTRTRRRARTTGSLPHENS